jgi:GT2 family glycosyltransferase
MSLGLERLPFYASRLGDRVLDGALYDREILCDWVSGSFMLARRAAIDDIGAMDERFFLYCEEIDYCLRMRRAGWSVAFLPKMTIFHQSSKTASEALTRQIAFARLQYMSKHFTPAHRLAGTLALGLGAAIRSIWPGRSSDDRRRRTSARSSLATLLGVAAPPFEHRPSGQSGTPENVGARRGT